MTDDLCLPQKIKRREPYEQTHRSGERRHGAGRILNSLQGVNMHYSRLAGLLIAASISMPSLAQAESVAIVNGTSIEKQDIDQAVSYIVRSSNGQAQDTPALREDVKNRLINREIILQEAKNRGLDKTPDVKRQITQASQDIMYRHQRQNQVKTELMHRGHGF